MTDKKESNELITIYEDWVEIGGAVWLKWRVEGEKKWHYKRTPYTEKPVIYMKRLPKTEYDFFYKESELDNREVIE